MGVVTASVPVAYAVTGGQTPSPRHLNRDTPRMPSRAGVVVTTTDPLPSTPNPTRNPGSDDDQEARDPRFDLPRSDRSVRAVDDPLTLAAAARIVRVALARRSARSVPAYEEEVVSEDPAKTR